MSDATQDLKLKDQSDIKIPHPPAEKVGGRRVKNPRLRKQGGQDLDQEADEAGDNPQDVMPPEQSSMDVDKATKGGSMQMLTGQQQLEQIIPSLQDLKHNPKAVPSTFFPPVYENTKSRRNLGGDYTQMTHKFDNQK
eukprot:TRINITY_DN97_c0_g1_i1.p1 TRINITY_DN97_c0_g1~~TRINITY_DN97_c0_g1_i1.p1  ORF type:complete len:137 (-),score=26.78 TRINITY_DN97_c0_g1_i1:105-515(-)